MQFKRSYADCSILSMPFGPRVLLTKSPTAIAPTKAERRAFSPFSSVTSSAKICVGLKAAYAELVQTCDDGRYEHTMLNVVRSCSFKDFPGSTGHSAEHNRGDKNSGGIARMRTKARDFHAP